MDFRLGQSAIGDNLVISEIEEVIVATGQRPDYTMAGELRLKIDPWRSGEGAGMSTKGCGMPGPRDLCGRP